MTPMYNTQDATRTQDIPTKSSNLFLDGEPDLDRDLEECESEPELLDTGLGEQLDLLRLDLPLVLSLRLDLGLGVGESA